MRKRARQHGVVLGDLDPGPRNAISDVDGVRVGHVTLVRGHGRLVVGRGPVRTGVTVVLPHTGNVFEERPRAAYETINGCGALLGALQIEEFGVLESPIGLTNTMCVGRVAMGLVRATLDRNPAAGRALDTTIPIVSECDDSYLNDARGLHVREDHAIAAVRAARASVAEGAVGAGTGMTCFDFKGGIGTASRVLPRPAGSYRVGALVLANFGARENLRIAGIPVGRHLRTWKPKRNVPPGSIVIVVATDAPLASRQLKRVARRSFLALGRLGSISGTGSGDIAVAFSTADPVRWFARRRVIRESRLHDAALNPLFKATVEAVEEAIVNGLFTAETTVGRDGNVSYGLPVPETLDLLDRYGRLR